MPTVNEMVKILNEAQDRGFGEYELRIGLPLTKEDQEKINTDVAPDIMESHIHSVISTNEEMAYLIGSTMDKLLKKYRDSLSN